MDRKAVFSGFLILIIAFSSILMFSQTSSAQASGTDTRGKIASDTTWTKTGSPYSLSGPVAVMDGATLRVEPGVVINLNSYYMQVNGTLTAIGSGSEPIYINDGSSFDLLNPFGPADPAGITFYTQSTDCALDYVVFNHTQVEVDSAARIAHSKGGSVIISGNPTLTGNSEMSITAFGGSPTITGNTLNSRIIIYQGSPIITNNQIACNGMGIFLGFKHGLLKTDTPIINGNTITGTFTPAIYVTGSATVQNNLIVGSGSSIGITVNGGQDGAGVISIQHNTIVGCQTGLQIGETTGTLTFSNNNIQNITSNYVYSQSSSSFSLANNYWGTTDTQTINNGIYDGKYDFNIGDITIDPILTVPDQTAPTAPTPTSTTQPTPSPSVPEYPITVILLFAILATTLTASVYAKKSKPRLEI
ncbi:MAG: hypothetical protein NWE93_00955 [Candidatus Bathyarchaeota archaeon]|nr:hypothetical protein [Candidatus Bathyarchaeota archaeon]